MYTKVPTLRRDMMGLTFQHLMCNLVVSDHVVAMTVLVRLCYGLASSLHLQQAVSQEVRSDRAAAASDIDSFFVY